MRYFITFCFLLCSFQAWSKSGKSIWREAKATEKIQLLNEYRHFYTELSKLESPFYEAWEINKTSLLALLISEAWAASNMNCIYAGWPSLRVGKYCSSPLRNNPQYSHGNCGENQMQCQPLLFGKDLCVPTSTREQRIMAFSNCNDRYQASNKSAEFVIKEIESEGKTSELLELMDFADNICSKGKQAGTGMCNRLTSNINHMRQEILRGNDDSKLSNSRPQANSTPIQMATEKKFPLTRSRLPLPQNSFLPVEPVNLELRMPEIAKPDPIQFVVPKFEFTPPTKVLIDEPQVNPISDSRESEMNDLLNAVAAVNKVTEIVNVQNPIDCPPELSAAFEREEPRPYERFAVHQKRSKNLLWENSFRENRNDDNLYPMGFQFTNFGPNEMTKNISQTSKNVLRKWRFISDDNSRRETYLWVTDDIGQGNNSELMERIILIIPRNVKPGIEEVGDELHVTLATGEIAVYDKKTKLVKSGVLSEKPINAGRNSANIDYNGSGISIRIDKMGSDPRRGSGDATITQNGKTCKIPTRKLWRDDNFLYKSDDQLLTFLNQKCNSQFSL